MKPVPDAYETLGVRRDASLDEIRISYRRSVQVLQPERFAGASEPIQHEAARRLSELTAAMEQIEASRPGEASGTGALGSVPFGGTQSPPAAPAPAPEPTATRTAVVPETPVAPANGGGPSAPAHEDPAQRAPGEISPLPPAEPVWPEQDEEG